MNKEMRIYLANLGAYNAGELIGEWVTLPMDEDDLREVMDEILLAEDGDGEVFGEELAIHDYEFPVKLHEYSNIFQVNEWAEKIENSYHDDDVIIAILDNFCTIEEGLQVLEDGDFMVYSNCSNMAEVAEQYLEETGGLQGVPKHLQYYIDFEAYGRDMEIEGTFLDTDDGYVQLF